VQQSPSYLKSFGLGLNCAFKRFGFAEALLGVLGGFFCVGTHFFNISGTFSVDPDFFDRHYDFPAFRFSIKLNSSSIRW